MENKWVVKGLKIVGLVLGVGMVVSLGRGLWQLYVARGRLETAKEDYVEIKEENLELKERLAEVQSEEFVEKQARNKLKMKLPGEKVVVMPEEIKLSGDQLLEEEEVEKATWRKWWELFK